MISFDKALELVRSTVRPLESEVVRLDEAANRVLAERVVARIDSPRADVSAMDGYAVRDQDLASFPLRLAVVGESFAGAGWDGNVAPDTCVRIFTGAPVPAGTDRVVIQENVRREGDIAIIVKHPGEGRHIRRRGSDFSAGDELLSAGHLLDSRAIVAAAAADLSKLQIYRQPLVHVLSTGDELAEPGRARERANAIPESVSFGVAALAERWGARCVGRTRLRDELEPMRAAAATTMDSVDVVVITGGASVGEKDFAKLMFEPLGLELIFSKVTIKPGKPVWLGRVRDKLVLGLPGNPTSAMVTARLFLAPLLSALSGRAIDTALQWRSLPLATPLPECESRETFHRARVVGEKTHLLSFQKSSAQKALAEADVLVRQPSNSRAVSAGEFVSVLDF